MTKALYFAGAFTVAAAVFFFAVAKGGIHEVAAAVLWCGGVLMIGLGRLLEQMQPVEDIAARMRARAAIADAESSR